jgi:hypothetical protein
VLLGIASVFTLGSKSRSTWGHILMSCLRLGSLFIATYNWQGYGGGDNSACYGDSFWYFIGNTPPELIACYRDSFTSTFCLHLNFSVTLETTSIIVLVLVTVPNKSAVRPNSKCDFRLRLTFRVMDARGFYRYCSEETAPAVLLRDMGSINWPNLVKAKILTKKRVILPFRYIGRRISELGTLAVTLK